MKPQYNIYYRNWRFSKAAGYNFKYGHHITCLDNDFSYQTKRMYRRIKSHGYNRYVSGFLDDVIHDEDVSVYREMLLHTKIKSMPTAWDDVRIGRNDGRSWKDYTKKRRQWQK